MSVKGSVLILIVSVILSGCEFTPTEENFVEIPSDPISSIEVNLSDLSDTISLMQLTVINYDLEFPKDVRHRVIVTVGEQKVYESQALPGSFELSPFQFPDGFHQLKMQVLTSSGTNSLADQLGYEVVLFEVKKVVWVDKSPPQKIRITKIEPIDGNLVIGWEKYPKPNFKSYLLYKNVYSEGPEPTISEMYSITSREQTSFIDPSYIGGKADYYIATQVTTSTNTKESDIYNYNSERVKIRDFKTVDGKLVVTWNKPKFYNAFQKYWLRKNHDYANPYFESTNINDTTCAINGLGFGIAMELELNTVPVNAFSGGGPSTAMYSTYREVYLGEKMDNHEAVFYNIVEQLVYYYKDEFLYVMHEGDNLPYDSINLVLNKSVGNKKSFGLSSNGKYLYVGAGKSLIQLNPITLDIIKNKDLPEMFSGRELYPFAIAVGNQNVLSVDVKTLFPTHQNGYMTDFMAMVDGNTFSVKDTIEFNTDILTITGNDDMSYVFERDSYKQRIFHINSLGLEVNRKDFDLFVYGECYFNGNAAYVYMYSRRWIVDLATLNITMDVPIQDWIYYINIDQARSELAGIVSSNNDYVVFDCVTMQEKKRIKMYQYSISDIVSDQNRFFYCNNVLYAARGYKIKL